MKNFVKTSDEHVADELRKNGFTELKRDGKLFVFVNNGKLNFSDKDKKEIIYSDVLSM